MKHTAHQFLGDLLLGRTAHEIDASGPSPICAHPFDHEIEQRRLPEASRGYQDRVLAVEHERLQRLELHFAVTKVVYLRRRAEVIRIPSTWGRHSAILTFNHRKVVYRMVLH